MTVGRDGQATAPVLGAHGREPRSADTVSAPAREPSTDYRTAERAADHRRLWPHLGRTTDSRCLAAGTKPQVSTGRVPGTRTQNLWIKIRRLSPSQ
jgi:hypothetical protein